MTGPFGIMGVTQDVTAREKAKEDMHSAQRRQEFLLELNDQLRSLDDPMRSWKRQPRAWDGS